MQGSWQRGHANTHFADNSAPTQRGRDNWRGREGFSRSSRILSLPGFQIRVFTELFSLPVELFDLGWQDE